MLKSVIRPKYLTQKDDVDLGMSTPKTVGLHKIHMHAKYQVSIYTGPILKLPTNKQSNTQGKNNMHPRCIKSTEKKGFRAIKLIF